MKTRVRNRPKYAALGMCPEWYDFDTFKKWAMENGYTDQLTIDRIENPIGYWPNNCRWVTNIQQQRNKETNRLVQAFGETKAMVEWAEDERCVVIYSTLRKRITKHGWHPERAITEPPHKNKRRLAGLSQAVNTTGILLASLPVLGQILKIWPNLLNGESGCRTHDPSLFRAGFAGCFTSKEYKNVVLLDSAKPTKLSKNVVLGFVWL